MIHYTDDSSTAYAVTEGQVLVFLMPVKDGKKGRRLLLGEFDTGSVIPGFHYTALGGEWIIGIVAVESAVIEAYAGSVTEELKSKFADTIGVELNGYESYEELIAEKYELRSVKEQGYIYAAKREQEKTTDRSLRLIYNLFGKNKRRGFSGVFTETGSPL